MVKIFFYVPMLFAKYTRFKGLNGSLQFFFKYFMLVFLASVVHIQSFSLIRFIISIFYMYSLYEFGYIQNDAETIKKENNPTKRLTNEDLAFYEKHKISIYVTRLGWALLLASLLMFSNTSCFFILYSIIIVPVFYLYNTIRNRYNLYIHIILMFLRLSVPVVISSLYIDFPLMLWILFIYPIPVFVQLSVKGKFGYKNKFFSRYIMFSYDKHNMHLFRIKYYIVFTLLLFIICASGLMTWWYLLPTGYYFLFTILSAIKNL